MAVPKRKTSPMKRGFRRSADALKAPTYVEDKDSGELRKQIDDATGPAPRQLASAATRNAPTSRKKVAAHAVDRQPRKRARQDQA